MNALMNQYKPSGFPQTTDLDIKVLSLAMTEPYKNESIRLIIHELLLIILIHVYLSGLLKPHVIPDKYNEKTISIR